MQESRYDGVGRVPEDELQARQVAVQRLLDELGLSAMVLTSAEDIFYLTGLTYFGHFAYSALVLPRHGDPVLVMREIEASTVRAQLGNVRFVGYDDSHRPGSVVETVVREQLEAAARLGYDAESLSVPLRVWEDLTSRLPDMQWIDVGAAMTRLRAVKSAYEIDCLRQAAALSDRAMQAVFDVARVGATQSDLAAAAFHAMVATGGEPPGFPPFIRSVDRLTHYHETWSQAPLVDGAGVFIELGASVGRYHSPLTRQVYVGRRPASVTRSAKTAADGLDAACAAMQPGATADDVYQAWQHMMRSELGDATYSFAHCGYAVGVGMPPSWVGGRHTPGLRPGSELELQENMTFHVMSWLVDQSGPDYCLSDTVLVTARGGVRLTLLSRDLPPNPTNLQ